MKLEDIRLTLADIDRIHQDNYECNKETGECFGASEEQISNAATDKAIKEILNHMNRRDVGGVNPEWAISNTLYQALSKAEGKE